MSGYTVYTLEFSDRKNVPVYEDLPEEIKNITRNSKSHEEYLSLVQDVDKIVELDLEEEEVVELLFQLSEVTRVGICRCDDTTDIANFRLYKKDDEIKEIDFVADYDVAESVFSSWDVKPESATFGEPSRNYLKEEHDFDAWTIWQFR